MMNDIISTVAVLGFLASIGVACFGLGTRRMEIVMLGCCIGIGSVLLNGSLPREYYQHLRTETARE